MNDDPSSIKKYPTSYKTANLANLSEYNILSYNVFKNRKTTSSITPDYQSFCGLLTNHDICAINTKKP